KTDTALYGYHSGAPTPDEYERALAEIKARLDARLEQIGAAPVELVEAPPPEHRSAPRERQRLVPTYGEALVEQAAREPRLVALGAVPGMALIAPFSEDEVRAAVEWAVHRAPGAVYIRLVSVPWALGFDPPPIGELVPGRGTVLRTGGDLMFVAAGPVMAAA